MQVPELAHGVREDGVRLHRLADAGRRATEVGDLNLPQSAVDAPLAFDDLPQARDGALVGEGGLDHPKARLDLSAQPLEVKLALNGETRAGSGLSARLGRKTAADDVAGLLEVPHEVEQPLDFRLQRLQGLRI